MKIKINSIFITTVLIMILILSIFGMAYAAAGGIDPVDKWAWGTNVGWINFDPTHGGVMVYDDHLEGYAWGENIGWVRLGSYSGGGTHTYTNDAADTYGVNNDGDGILSGYAWGTNVGWINFNPTHGGVTIDPSTGSFDGYAWGENIGWIRFKNTDGNAYNVVTLWRPDRVDPDDPDVLPATGFPRDRVTTLTEQPASKAYEATEIMLEIPRLNLEVPIVGVPIVAGEWDLTWLGQQAGWLHGTAFPSWAGNSALTGHVYDANGEPGIFHDLHNLQWGDELIVHAYDQSYVYEVRSVDQFVSPADTNSVYQHEDFPWLTLITCKGFEEADDSYRWRVVVRAVQTEIQ